MLLAVENWPDFLDAWATFALLGLVLAVVVAGYAFMVLDFRAYLRSLTRVLSRVVRYFPQVPEWARYETPAAVAAFGLRMPCTEEDLKQAYRAGQKTAPRSRRRQTEVPPPADAVRRGAQVSPRTGPTPLRPRRHGPRNGLGDVAAVAAVAGRYAPGPARATIDCPTARTRPHEVPS